MNCVCYLHLLNYNRFYKEKKELILLKKKGISVALIALMLSCTVVLSSCGRFASQDTTSSPTPQENPYLDIKTTNELQLFSQTHEAMPLVAIDSFYNEFASFLQSEKYDFSHAPYYGLEKAIDLYHNTIVKKSTNSSLLDALGNIDATQLCASVKENNKKETAKGKNAVNTFYTETSKEDQVAICNLIADVLNSTCTKTELQQLGNTLSAMTMFNRTGSPSNAYITNHLTFVYNPTMSEMYANTQAISSDDDEETIKKSVIVHEIMHLKQHNYDDLLDENGIEVGMCRDYNVENQDKKLPVDCLWNSWILEAAAELGMADYLGIQTHTYTKKISYVTSYNMSRFSELINKENLLENISFSNTLEDVYSKLSLESSQDQLDFLKFMYSVEILQDDPEEFWNNYTAITGLKPTDEEKLAIRYAIRSEVVKYLSYGFYTNLAKSIHEGKIGDWDTLFYLLRLWEIDCFGHLEYNKIDSLDSAKPFIEWQEKTQTQLFQLLTNNTELSVTFIQGQYSDYCLQTLENDATYDNCSLNSLNAYASEYIRKAKENYRSGNFVRNQDMSAYILSN